jgi:DNA-binding response OmpR family regulator
VKILLVDDDTTLLEVTAFALRRAGFLVVLAHDSEQALRVWSDEQPDLIILDIQLPGKDGLTLCREIRALSNVPIILLTVRSSDEDIVHGLEIGADDYLTKPFSPKQLIARARAILRRSSTLPKPAQIAAGDLVLDTTQQVVRTLNAEVRLTSLEFRLLHYLLINQGQIVPTDAILTHVWGYADSGDRKLLKQLVYRVRQKIESPGADQQYIATIPGVGYTIAKQRDPAPRLHGIVDQGDM